MVLSGQFSLGRKIETLTEVIRVAPVFLGGYLLFNTGFQNLGIVLLVAGVAFYRFTSIK